MTVNDVTQNNNFIFHAAPTVEPAPKDPTTTVALSALKKRKTKDTRLLDETQKNRAEDLSSLLQGTISEDILLCCISLLDAPDLSQLARTCQQMRRLVGDWSVQTNLLRLAWGIDLPEAPPVERYRFYQNLQEGRFTQQNLQLHQGWAYRLKVHGNTLLSASDTGVVKCLDATHAIHDLLITNHDCINLLYISEPWLVLGSYNGHIYVFDRATQTLVHTFLEESPNDSCLLQFHIEGDKLYAFSSIEISVWNIVTGDLLKIDENEEEGEWSFAQVVGSQIFLLSDTGRVDVRDLQTLEKVLDPYEDDEERGYFPDNMKVSKSRIVSTTPQGYLCIANIDQDRSKDIHSQKSANGKVGASDLHQALPVAKQPMYKHMVDAASNRFLNHDVYKYLKVSEQTHMGHCLEVDGSRAFVGTHEGSIKVINVAQGTLVYTLNGHTGAITAFHIGKTRLISASEDGKVKIWDTEKRCCLHTLNPDIGSLYALCFMNTKLIVGSETGQIAILNFIQSESAATCANV